MKMSKMGPKSDLNPELLEALNPLGGSFYTRFLDVSSPSLLNKFWAALALEIAKEFQNDSPGHLRFDTLYGTNSLVGPHVFGVGAEMSRTGLVLPSERLRLAYYVDRSSYGRFTCGYQPQSGDRILVISAHVGAQGCLLERTVTELRKVGADVVGAFAFYDSEERDGDKIFKDDLAGRLEIPIYALTKRSDFETRSS